MRDLEIGMIERKEGDEEEMVFVDQKLNVSEKSLLHCCIEYVSSIEFVVNKLSILWGR